MSGINNVVKGDGCVLKKWVCRSQPCFVLRVCVCVCFYFLIVFYLHCSIALLFCICALKHFEVSSGVNRAKSAKLCSSSHCTWAFLRPNQTTRTISTERCPAFPPQNPYQLNREAVFAQRGDCQDFNTMPQLNDHPVRPVSFLQPRTFLYFSSRFLSVCLCLL